MSFMRHVNNSMNAVRDPLAAARSVGGAAANGVKSWGGGWKEMNPFADNVPKPNTSAYQVDPTAFEMNERQNNLYGDMNRDRQLLGIRDPFQMQAAQLDPAQQAQVRERQMALADQLRAQSMGEGPSLARMQMLEATDRGLAQASQMAAGQRGMSAGMRARMMNQMAGQTQADAARAAAMGRAQEQMNAQNSLASVLAGTRGQDLSMAQQNAALQQGANQANLQSQITNRGQTDQARLAFYNQMAGLANREQDARMGLEAMKSDNHNAAMGAATGMYGAQQQAQTGRTGAVLGALGAGAMAYGTYNQGKGAG